MKKYLFIVLLVGVCFGQKNPDDSIYNIAMEIVKLGDEQGIVLTKEFQDIYRFQLDNGSFGQGSFSYLIEYFLGISEKVSSIGMITNYFNIIRLCGGSNEFTNQDLELKIADLSTHIDLTRRVIKDISDSLKNEYSVSKLANNYLRYMDKLQGIINS